MSVAQAEEFYGPVLPVLQDKLGDDKGREAWEDIVEFMSGGRPSAISDEQRQQPGTGKVHRARLPGRRCRPQNPRRPRPDRSEQGAARVHPPSEFGQTDHGQRGATLPIRPRTQQREMEIVQVRRE